MISYIKGTLAAKLENSVIIDNGGMGYEVIVPINSPIYLSGEGEEVVCHTYMAVREDDVSLYGFADRQTLKMFRMLLTVNGIGAKAAISILSTLDTVRLTQAIALEDDKSISQAPGVGKKTAQRVVLELKDKVGSVDTSGVKISDEPVSLDTKNEAVAALISLGYARSEAISALAGIEAETSEEYIKKALKNLF